MHGARLGFVNSIVRKVSGMQGRKPCRPSGNIEPQTEYGLPDMTGHRPNRNNRREGSAETSSRHR
jgi:hypothetical protein